MTGAFSDPRMPPAEACILRPILDRWAEQQPDKVFARFADGTEWTYAETRRQANEVAVGMQRLGIAQGEHVLSWLPNGPDALRIWFGLNYMGAVYVPINTAYKGRLLAHVIDPAELIDFLAPRMAHFMISRYVRLIDALPKTPTQKVQKHLLKAEGITADTWDREAAGIRIRREKIGAGS